MLLTKSARPVEAVDLVWFFPRAIRRARVVPLPRTELFDRVFGGGSQLSGMRVVLEQGKPPRGLPAAAPLFLLSVSLL